MKAIVFTVLALCLLSAIHAEEKWGFKEEDDVVVLTKDTFDDFISKHQFSLVEFYAPWCGHCKKLAPEYAKAAAQLKNSEPGVPLAKVDATEHPDLGTRFDVKGYPSLKFFVNGSPLEYAGGRTTDEIVSWINKKTGPASTLVNDSEGLETLKKDNQVLVAYFGEENDDYKNFTATATAIDGLAFAHSFNADLIKEHGNKVVLFKHFDELKNVHDGSITSDNLNTFISNNRYPLVMDFEGDSAIERIFGKEATALFLFAESEGDYTQEFTAAAKEYKGDVVFSTSKVSTGLGNRLSEYVGVKVEQAPTIRLVKPSQGDLVKYVYEGEFKKDQILKFLNDFDNGNLKRTYKTQEIPEKNDEAVKVIVGKNYDDLVTNSDKDVLLEFYAPWCGHCKTLAPKYENVAKKLAYLSDKLIIAKVDATENEIPNVSVKGFPTIKFFKNGQKSDPKEFEGDRTEEGILKYLKENSSFDWSEDETDL